MVFLRALNLDQAQEIADDGKAASSRRFPNYERIRPGNLRGLLSKLKGSKASQEI
jgi:hypothetical protein